MRLFSSKRKQTTLTFHFLFWRFDQILHFKFFLSIILTKFITRVKLKRFLCSGEN